MTGETRAGSGRQRRAPLRAAPPDDRATAAGPHAGPKAVLALAAAVVGLVRALHARPLQVIGPQRPTGPGGAAARAPCRVGRAAAAPGSARAVGTGRGACGNRRSRRSLEDERSRCNDDRVVCVGTSVGTPRIGRNREHRSRPGPGRAPWHAGPGTQESCCGPPAGEPILRPRVRSSVRRDPSPGMLEGSPRRA